MGGMLARASHTVSTVPTGLANNMLIRLRPFPPLQYAPCISETMSDAVTVHDRTLNLRIKSAGQDGENGYCTRLHPLHYASCSSKTLFSIACPSQSFPVRFESPYYALRILAMELNILIVDEDVKHR